MAFKAERRVLLTNIEIKARIADLAQEIARDFNAKNPQDPATTSFEKCLMLVCVLQSALPFAQALQYELYQQGVSTQLEFVEASSYGEGMESTGNPVYSIEDQLKQQITNADVLVVEDMIDSGTTLFGLVALLLTLSPKSLKVAVLLKKIRKSVDIGLKPYVGFLIPNLWVDGFGIDSANLNRELKEIWAFLQTRSQYFRWAKFRASSFVRRTLVQAKHYLQSIPSSPINAK